MKVRNFLKVIIILIMVGCSYSEVNQSTHEPLPIIATTIIVTPSPSKSPTINFTISPAPSTQYLEINKGNIYRLSPIYQWEVDDVLLGALQRSTSNFWFNESNQFIMIVRIENTVGIQSFETAGFTQKWLVQTGTSEATAVENDQVITYQGGLKIFNKQGKEIQKVDGDGFCGENTASHMVTMLKKNLVITGHQHYGDIVDSYGTSRLLIWNVNKNTCQDLFREFAGRLWSLSIDKSGRYISYSVLTSYTDVSDGLLKSKVTNRLYNLDLGREVCDLEGSDTLFINHNQLIVYSLIDGTMTVVDPLVCTIIRKFNVGMDISAFTVNSDSSLLVGVSSRLLKIWDVNNGDMLYEVDLIRPVDNISQVGFSPDGRFLVISGFLTSMSEKDQVVIWGVTEK